MTDPLFDRLMGQGESAEQAGDVSAACRHYAQAVQHQPALGIGWLFLGHALLCAGRTPEAAAVAALGVDRDPGVLAAADNARLPGALRQRARRLDQLLRQVLTEQHAAAVAEAQTLVGDSLPRLAAAIWVQTHAGPVAWRTALQRPWLLYLPDLPATPWMAPMDSAWGQQLAARAPALQDEAAAAVAILADQLLHPYIPADQAPPGGFEQLAGAMHWGALHLYQHGNPGPDALLAAMPQTVAALSQAPCVDLHGCPMEAFLSLLRPGTDIPPHHGLANSAQTVHLPLSVPDNCGLEVAGEVRVPTAGVLLAFDDTFLHRAWNHGSAVRSHLVFEAWHPDLDAAERAGLAHCLRLRERWHQARAVPQDLLQP